MPVWIAHFDGDDVGPILELLLLDGELERAREYSARLQLAMERLRMAVAGVAGADVFVFGGDDLLVKWPEFPSSEWLEGLRRNFQQDSGRTLSVGVGESTAAASENLRRAKLQGKDELVFPAGEFI